MSAPTPPVKGNAPEKRLTIALNAIIIFAAGSIFVAGLEPSTANWGFHFLGMYPPAIQYLMPLLILLLLNPALRHSLVGRARGFSIFLTRQLKRNRTTSGAFVIALSGCLFWVFKTETHFLGDGYLRLRNLSTAATLTELVRPLKHEPLVALLVFELHQMLAMLGVSQSVEFTYRILSIICGMLFILIAWKLSKLISDDPFEQVLITIFVLASGASQMFFGYVEDYAPTYVAFLTFILVSMMYLKKKVSIIVPFIVFVVSVVLHFGAIVLSAGLLPLAIESIRRKETKTLVFAVLASILIAPILFWMCGYTPKLLGEAFNSGFKHSVTIPIVGQPNQTYTLFSKEHLLDLGNIIVLLQPTALIVLIVSSMGWRKLDLMSIERLFLIMAMLGMLSFIVIANCDLGMSRDWDLLASFGVGLSVAAAYCWFNQLEKTALRSEFFTVMTLIALIQCALWIGINHDEEKALARLDIIQEGPGWSGLAKANLSEERAIFYRNRKDFAKAVQYYERCVAVMPSHSRFLEDLALMYQSNQNPLQAIHVYERMDSLNIADVKTHTNLGILYMNYRRYDDAWEQMLKAEELDTSSAQSQCNLGAVVIARENSYNNALPYFLKAITRDPSYSQAYYNAARCYEAMGLSLEAKKYDERFSDLTSGKRN